MIWLTKVSSVHFPGKNLYCLSPKNSFLSKNDRMRSFIKISNVVCHLCLIPILIHWYHNSCTFCTYFPHLLSALTYFPHLLPLYPYFPHLLTFCTYLLSALTFRTYLYSALTFRTYLLSAPTFHTYFPHLLFTLTFHTYFPHLFSALTFCTSMAVRGQSEFETQLIAYLGGSTL